MSQALALRLLPASPLPLSRSSGLCGKDSCGPNWQRPGRLGFGRAAHGSQVSPINFLKPCQSGLCCWESHHQSQCWSQPGSGPRLCDRSVIAVWPWQLALNCVPMSLSSLAPSHLSPVGHVVPCLCCTLSLPAVSRVQRCCSWSPGSPEALTWGSLCPSDKVMCRVPALYRSTLGHVSCLCCTPVVPRPRLHTNSIFRPSKVTRGDARGGFIGPLT